MVSAAGIDVSVPSGWDAEIFTREPDFAPQSGAAASRPVVHLGTFPLPPGRGDFGSGAVEIMNGDDLLVVLFEYGPESAGTPLFAGQGVPTVSAGDFDPNMMQRPIAGQSGAQYFFTTAGRAFCLYIVLGAHARRNELVPEINQVLGGLSIEFR